MIYPIVPLQKKAIIALCACLLSFQAFAEPLLRILATHFPPYEFETAVEGLRGYDVEVVEEAFRREGIYVEVEFLPWPRAVEIVYAGRAFALLTCTRNKEREKYLFFSEVISTGTNGYFLRKSDIDPNFDSVEELHDQSIVAVRGYAMQMTLEKLGIKHITARTDTIALALLNGGRVDFYYAVKEANAFIAKQMRIQDKLKYHPFESKGFHLCVSKKWPDAKHLLHQFNAGLSQLTADGTYQEIHDKYR